VAWTALAVGAACGESRPDLPAAAAPAPSPGRLFTALAPDVTGIRFTNRIIDTPDANVFTYRNHYNGGGVAIGDLDGDGRPEVLLASNQQGTRVYRNRGAFRFEDVSDATGITRDAPWTTGLLLADLDGDGRLDLYESHAGPVAAERRRNRLWINQGPGPDGVPRFVERAAAWGVADEGYTTQAAVLDMDRDGDLDLFVLNNSPRPVSSFGLRNERATRSRDGGHRLYRNDGTRFTDVTEAAGIHSPEIAFGLGVGVADLDRDGWPDLYVANDFFERDYVYRNRGDGTFEDVAERAMPVMSYFSMGMDIADADNDGWPDVYTTDMLPETERRLKTVASYESYDVYRAKVRNGYHHQSMRNMLQRNNGDGTFSDVGRQSGVAATDWSWSALFLDADLDGAKDLFVTNGLARDVTSQDYVAFLADNATMRGAAGGRTVDYMGLIAAMSTTPIPNYLFRNEGGLRFRPVTTEWGVGTPSISSGAAWGDLDGDGALDLVVNNVDQPAFVYRNDARTVVAGHHAVPVRLAGEGRNRFGVGARVELFTDTLVQLQELHPARGFQSSQDYLLAFGVGARQRFDSLRVTWADGRRSLVAGGATDSVVRVSQAGATAGDAPAAPASPGRGIVEVDSTRLAWRHLENDYVDFDRERLLPHMLSTEGPALAVGDIDGDGLDDLYVGGAKEQSGRLLRQGRGGRFAPDSLPFTGDAVAEDVGACFFDADGDRDLDLYVVSGGNEFADGAPALQDRLYRNDGRGRFAKVVDALPIEGSAGSRVAAADYDGDGDIDLFVGGRVVPGSYGLTPRSLLLRNDGRGRFTDVAAELAPAVASAGMVTDGAWVDVDQDSRLDLVVVGEWMPITVFRNGGGGRLAPVVVPGLARTEGWWNRLLVADVSGDGRPDFIVGNLGENGLMTATDSTPARLFIDDFDGNGFAEPLLTTHREGRDYPLVLRDDLLKALPPLKARYLNYANYAGQAIEDVLGAAAIGRATRREARRFASAVARSMPTGGYIVEALPAEVQLAPIFALAAADVDGDGDTDVLVGGNFDAFPTQVGRMHASRGAVLVNDGTGRFAVRRGPAGSLSLSGQVRDVARLRLREGPAWVAVRNDAPALLLRPTRRGTPRPPVAAVPAAPGRGRAGP
jgi:hypothetical protein